MSAIRYALLTLLAREPLSGYDIKQQMNGRIGPFWKAGSNQVYPELAKLETEGLVTLQSVEQLSYRPARKLYAITEAGKQALAEWTVEPGEMESMRDDFLLKAYNAWLVEPEEMAGKLADIRMQHAGKLSVYEAKIAELEGMRDPSNPKDPLLSSIAVVEFGAAYERLYIDWCDRFVRRLRGEE